MAAVKKTLKESNQLFYGDNLDVLRKYIKDETIDLCYIDPPFNSKRNYNQIYNNIGKEDKAQAQAFVDTWTWDEIAEHGYSEIISNYNGVFTKQSIDLIVGLSKVIGKGSLLAYLISMTLRIAEIQRVLKPTGSFYLHCDPTASHYLKLIIDSIFCGKGGDFKNEIIWCYSIGGKSKNRFGAKHDVIFYYTKSSKDIHTFNESGASIPRKLNTHMKMGKDADGRVYQEKVDRKSQKVYRYYLDEGKIAEDYWIDIETLNREDRERLGYPTQKPEKLLERIINTSSNKGDLILDAYCGCGTTVAVAEKLKRKWIGIDITYQSISLILKRLKDSYGDEAFKSVKINGVPQDLESAIALANKSDDRTRKEFEKWAVLTYTQNKAIINEKKGGDGGIDGIVFMADYDDKNQQTIKEVLFSVKSNKTLAPTVIRDLFGTIEREGAPIGILLTLYPMPNLVKESKKYGTYESKMFDKTYPKIIVVSVSEILEGKRIDLPQPIEVLKKAQSKTNQDQISLF